LTPEIAADETMVTLRALQFHARIGVLPHEAEIAQPVEIDLTLWVRREKGEIGPATILDYRHAYEVVSDVITAGHIKYLEEAAERIATRALSLPLVVRARVAVRKPSVALPGPLSHAEVAIERSNA
jgi:dihydroneopterin aldolase